MGNQKKHSWVYTRMLEHNKDYQIGREWTRERWLRLRERQQQQNGGIQLVVQVDTSTLFAPLSNLFIFYWSILIFINCAIWIILRTSLNYQIICGNVHVNLYIHHKKVGNLLRCTITHIKHMYYYLGKTTFTLTK